MHKRSDGAPCAGKLIPRKSRAGPLENGVHMARVRYRCDTCGSLIDGVKPKDDLTSDELDVYETVKQRHPGLGR